MWFFCKDFTHIIYWVKKCLTVANIIAQQVKLLLGIPTSSFMVPGIKSRIHFQSSCLVRCNLEGSSWRPGVWVLTSIWDVWIDFLACGSASLSPDCYRHWDSEPTNRRSCSLILKSLCVFLSLSLPIHCFNFSINMNSKQKWRNKL